MCRWRGLLLAACGWLTACSAAHGTITFRTASDVRVGAGPTAVAFAAVDGPRLVVGRDAGLALVGPLDSDFPIATRVGSVQFVKSVIVGAFTARAAVDIACIAGTEPAVNVLRHTGAMDFDRTPDVTLPARPRRLRRGPVGTDGMHGIFASHDAGIAWLAPLGGGRFATHSVSTHPFPTDFDVGDLDRDGLTDVVVVDSGDNRLQVAMGRAGNTFATTLMVPTVRQPSRVVVADGNADGRPDLFVVGKPGAAVQWQTETGTFGAPTMLWSDPQLGDAAAADADGDGAIDLVVANAGRGIVALLLGLGDGTFELRRSYAVGAGPTKLVVADVTRDDRPDILVLNELSDSVTLLRGLGGGHFDGAPTIIGTAVDFAAIAVTDIDADGHLDMAVTSEQTGRLSLFLGNGHGDFAALPAIPVGRQLRGIVAGDLDGNGVTDLAMSDFGADRVAILAGNGQGGFAPPRYLNVGQGPAGITTGDFQGRGPIDLAVANSLADSVTVLYNDGRGDFPTAVTFPVVSRPSFLLVGDVNKDRRPDLLVGNDYSDTVSILHGDGRALDRPRTDRLASSARAALAEDFDRDGHVDLAIPNEVGKAIDILPGRGKGAFGERLTVPVGHQPRSVVSGDFNGDGRIDLVVLHRDPPAITILLNLTPPSAATRRASLTPGEQTH